MHACLYYNTHYNIASLINLDITPVQHDITMGTNNGRKGANGILLEAWFLETDEQETLTAYCAGIYSSNYKSQVLT